VISNTPQLEESKINELAEQYTREGYSVIREPSEFDLPFGLNGYRPDLVATKEGLGLIIEVKTKLTRLPVERFRTIAEEVGKHPGWRFLLITLDDVESQNPPGTSDDMPNWTQLRHHATQASDLLSEGKKEPALLFLWSIFEALLRKRAIEMSIPIERFPVKRLINHMYSMGELSLSQFDLTNSVLEIRNKLAHGFFARLDERFMNQFNSLIMNLIDDWGHSD
jgi:hypothetical protein